MRAVLWVVLMIGWPLLVLTIGDWFVEPQYELTGRLDRDSFYSVVWLPASRFLVVAGWMFITYFCIGKKSAVVLALVWLVFYISPLPMYLGSSHWDCGSIPVWKCRWTCKSTSELIDLGIGYPYISNTFWWGNPDVIKAGGLCN